MSNKKSSSASSTAPVPLATERLRWMCDPNALPFETTEEVEPIAGVVGQASAVEALRFGLECDAPGQNVFVRGLSGSGRMTLVQRLLEELKPACKVKFDRCYVHNFKEPQRPRLITLGAGRSGSFRRRVKRFAEYARDGLIDALNAEAVRARREALEKREREAVEAITEPFQKALAEAGMALVSVKLGANSSTAIFPVVDGKPVPPEEFDGLLEAGTVTQERYDDYRERRDAFARQLSDLGIQVAEVRAKTAKAMEGVLEEAARSVLTEMAAPIHAEFSGEDVGLFLEEVLDHIVDAVLSGSPPPIEMYEVNIVARHRDGEDCPVIIENTPTITNLLGSADREWTPQGPTLSSFRSVRGGSLLRADGGYLILDARDIVSEPGAWKALMRTLRSGLLEIVPTDLGTSLFQQTIKPEPIPVRLRVILVGDATTYYLLDAHDPDFANQFKVLSDFDSLIAREPDGLRQYAGVLARVVREEGLLHFDRDGVAALAEHGARVAAHRGDLTARFARISDIAREASFLAGKAGRTVVCGDSVREAVSRTKQRANLPSRRFHRLIKEGTIHVRTEGEVVGQINGLAVIGAGPITYGFPARITATIGPGHAGIIDIEGRASLSGSIHTKGFHILGGLIRHLLDLDHPMAFSASLAFEQSYGGIDGDSASGAEACCLLSALTGVPIRQSFAMTGAIDQFGRIQSIGGVNEKIEGFFDTCRDVGLTGSQGVIIPESNSHDLMLRHDLVEACREGRFAIYAVEHVTEALELLTGMEAGVRDDEGQFPEESLLGIAEQRATEFWLKSLQSPGALFEFEDVEGEEEEEPEEAEA